MDKKVDYIPYELTKELNNLSQVVSWYQDIQQGFLTLNRVKIHILGNGRIGKTQLQRRLKGLGFDASIESTHGIEIHDWDLSVVGPEFSYSEDFAELLGDKKAYSLLSSNENEGGHCEAKINSWDFGGQDIYLGTHSLFLDDTAVYCILWHPDFENEDVVYDNDIPMRNRPLSYWLAYVQSLAGKDAPVIVAQSQCDKAARRKPAPIPNNHGFTRLEQTSFSAKTEDGLAQGESMND